MEPIGKNCATCHWYDTANCRCMNDESEYAYENTDVLFDCDKWEEYEEEFWNGKID